MTFVATGKEDGIQVLYKDETVWTTQKAMATLFDVDRSVITKHLKNIFDSEELVSERVCAKIAHTAEDGKTYNTLFYNLDAIISVGYRVNSIRATQFRQWCTYVIRQFAVRGYIVDKKRMEKARLSIWQMKEAREYKQTELGLLPEGWEVAMSWI